MVKSTPSQIINNYKKASCPTPNSNVIWEIMGAFQREGGQPKMKVIHFVIKWIMFYQYFYFQYVTPQKFTQWYVKTTCW